MKTKDERDGDDQNMDGDRVLTTSAQQQHSMYSIH
jgi:hypothetical protein